MTGRDATSSLPSAAPPTGTPADLAALEAKIVRSRRALVFEGVWRGLQPLLIVVGVFLIVSFLGVWGMLPDTARWVGLALFALAAVASTWRWRPRLPTRAEAIARLDTSLPGAHRPVATLEDALAGAGSNADTDALWRAHLARTAARANEVAVERPHPLVARRDPFALRGALVVALVASAVFANGQWRERVGEAVAGRTIVVAVVPPRVDAWVTPPGYTGRAPIFLGADTDRDAVLRVPQGSVFNIRVDRPEGVTVTAPAGPVEGVVEPGGTGTTFSATLGADGIVTLAQPGLPARPYRFAVDPDAPPKIAIEGRVQETAGGAVRVRYRVEDDFGVVSAQAEFTAPARAADAPRSLGLASAREPRPLVGAPEMALRLPQSRARQGTETTTRDLTAHPWAGGRVDMTLVARDDAGQEGRSATVTIELPQRAFRRPLARVLVEQRRNLAMDAERRAEVQAVLDLVTLDPVRRAYEARVYVALRALYFRAANAQDDQDLIELLDGLWQVALSIEDGDLSDAERRLRDAQDRLERALEQGASDEEIRRLMEELRQAMADFMRELAERALRDQREGRDQQPRDPNQRTITQNDLDRMMREMENAARSGQRQAARDMLNQLRDMMNAMRNSQPQIGQDSGDQQDMLDELGDMIREQQRLMDQTFRERQRRQQQGRNQQQGQRQQGQQGQRQQGQQGQQGEQDGEGGDQMGELRQGQGNLRQRLQQMLDQLRQGGRDPGRELGDADGDMGRAEQQLGQGEPGNALGQQGRALDNLRRGAQNMMREMMGEGDQAGDNPGGNPQGQGSRQQRADPLQRNPFANDNDDTNDNNSRLDSSGRSVAERTQRILEEVRRRLADPSRPRIELDYLQRLMRPF